MKTNELIQKAGLMICTAAAAVILLGANGQQPEHASLTPHEKLIAGQIGFDEAVLTLVKDVVPDSLHRMSGYDQNGYQIVVDGFTVSVQEHDEDRVLEILRQRLLPKKYMAFVIEVNEGIKSAKIGILKGTDQYEILRLMQTNGDDYDITNEDVIERLMEWEKRYPFDILGAGNDWVEIEFKSVPADLKAFAQEVYDFSPDVVDQEMGSIEELIRQIKSTKRLMLFWEQ